MPRTRIARACGPAKSATPPERTLRHALATLFGLVLLAKLLNLHALLLDFLLLLLDLSLRLLIGSFLVLHRVPDRVTGYSTQSAADRSTRTWMADRGANDGAGASAEACPTQSALFTCGKRLPCASRGEDCRS
jgi:hypothetical protein